KLAIGLLKKSKTKNLYLLDEPTVGLHFDDVKNLINLLKKIVKNGDTVILVEHNLEIIRNSDYIIDIGPDGGDKGGEIIAQGSLNELLNCKKSYTARELR
ncbi:MAG: excinuclease ABC subunit UvrA, partial [Bacteroidota bacterium]|nr:excinuclease ABC subunit UvrA [Bacteroidota bacterium]